MAERRALLRRLAPALLLVALGIAWLVPALPGLDLAPSETDAAAAWERPSTSCRRTPLVLVAFDADLGTYAEIRPTVRAAIGDLLAREARLAFVSLTPEGRALASGELDRSSARGEPAAPDRPRLRAGRRGGHRRAVARAAGAGGRLVVPGLTDEGIAAIDAVFVVGGNDIGPRSWVEQFLPRIARVPSSPSRRRSCFRSSCRTPRAGRSTG